MSNEVKLRIKQRIDTKENWIANDPILLAGEIAFTSNDDTFTNPYKIGDGTSKWSELEYNISETPIMVGATESADGSSGLVTQPLIADKDKFLKGDGTWDDLPIASSTNLGTVKIGSDLSIDDDGTVIVDTSTTGLSSKFLPLTGGTVTGNILCKVDDPTKTFGLSIQNKKFTKGTTTYGEFYNCIDFLAANGTTWKDRLALFEQKIVKNSTTPVMINSMRLVAYNPTVTTPTEDNLAEICVTMNANNVATATAPNPADDDDSNSIATTSFVRAQGYITEVPTATSDTIGGIKIGSGLAISDDGTLSNAFELNDALTYKGTISGGESGSVDMLPSADKGDVYKVSIAGYVGTNKVEVGDMLICNTASTSASTIDNWDIIQSNTDVFSGATETDKGTTGLVPAPTTSDTNKFLKGDGTWSEVETLKGATTLSGYGITDAYTKDEVDGKIIAAGGVIVEDNLDSEDSSKALSANQGRVLSGEIGDLTTLETDDKNNLVSAINELEGKVVTKAMIKALWEMFKICAYSTTDTDDTISTFKTEWNLNPVGTIILISDDFQTVKEIEKEDYSDIDLISADIEGFSPYFIFNGTDEFEFTISIDGVETYYVSNEGEEVKEEIDTDYITSIKNDNSASDDIIALLTNHTGEYIVDCAEKTNSTDIIED